MFSLFLPVMLSMWNLLCLSKASIESFWFIWHSSYKDIHFHYTIRWELFQIFVTLTKGVCVCVCVCVCVDFLTSQLIYKPGGCLSFAAICKLPLPCFQQGVALTGWGTGTHLSSARSRAGGWTAAEGCCPDSSRSPWSSWEWACLSPTDPQSGALSLWGRQKSIQTKSIA